MSLSEQIPETAPQAPAPADTAMMRLSRVVVIALSVVGIAMTMVQTLPIIAPGMRPITSAFYYALLGVFLAVVFLRFPADRRDRPMWLWLLDWAMAVAALVICTYLAFQARRIMTAGWSFAAPFWPTVGASILFILSIDGVRRCAGLLLAVVCAVFGLYPMIADSMPGVLWGTSSAGRGWWRPMRLARNPSSASPSASWPTC